MCEFISWTEVTDGKGKVHLFYLTEHDIWHTRRGKDLIKYCGNNDDLVGHGAIDYYFELKGRGENRECTDFSDPDNFPAEIVKDIKKGAFRGMGMSSHLLSKLAWTEFYKKIKQPRAEYQKVENSSWAEYLNTQSAEYEQPSWAEYLNTQSAEYEQPSWAEYLKKRQSVRAKYLKIEQPAFWDLFAVKKNRAKAWQ